MGHSMSNRVGFLNLKCGKKKKNYFAEIQKFISNILKNTPLNISEFFRYVRGII